jgi:hypothetical protein
MPASSSTVFPTGSQAEFGADPFGAAEVFERSLIAAVVGDENRDGRRAGAQLY